MIERSIPFTSRPVDIARAPGGAKATSRTNHGGSHQVAAGSQAGPPAGAGERALSDKQLVTLLGDIQTSLGELQDQRRNNLDEMQRVAIELSIAVASRLVHAQIDSGDFAVEKMIGRVVEQMKPNVPLTVRLHPNDLALFKERTKDTTPAWQELREIQLVPDGTLQRGDCRVDSGETGLLSEIESQLSEIRCHLLEALGDAQNERRNAQKSDRSLRRFPDRRDTA